MAARLAHRGPDEARSGGGDLLSYGFRRLSIIDIATGSQPVTNERGTVHAMLNGEIYNFVELRTELERGGHQFTTESDSEVLAHLWERDGPSLLQRLNGMFALAIWDDVARTLFLARDRLGKKPLFYLERGRDVIFASELKAFLAVPDVDWSLDETSLDAYLHYQYVPSPRSIVKAIRKLPPGHSLLLSPERSETTRYWQLDYEPKSSLTREQAVDQFRDLFRDSVRLRLRSDVPLGAFLSGGLDSSSVVLEMCGLLQAPPKTFAIGFDDPKYDERVYARAVAEALGTEHHEFVVDPESATKLGSLVWHLDEPMADPSAIPTWHVSRLTRSLVTVALNGDGGDELFAGYERYRAAQLLGALDSAPRLLRRGLGRSLERIGSAVLLGRLGQRAGRLGELMGMSAADRYDEMMSIYDEAEIDVLLQPDFAVRTGPRFRIDGDWATRSAEDPLDRLLAIDTATYLPEDLLVKVDRMSMAHGLETRSPYLDYRLVEFAARLPAQFKMSKAHSKVIVRDAFSDRLPKITTTRKKQGFAVPLDSWLAGDLGRAARELVLGPDSQIRDYLRSESMARVFDRHGRDGHQGHRVWSLIVLELWLRLFRQRRSPGEFDWVR